MGIVMLILQQTHPPDNQPDSPTPLTRRDKVLYAALTLAMLLTSAVVLYLWHCAGGTI